MRHTLLYLFLSLAMLAEADVLSDILRGDYAARTLSVCEQDSILNGAPDSRYRLLQDSEQQIFRHSYTARYYIEDTLRKTRLPLCSEPVRDAQMSPNGKYIAYVQGGGLYLHKLEFGTSVAVCPSTAEDGLRDEDVLEGVTDWLYEEEFGVTSVMAFSPDSKMLAFLRTREHHVPTFTWQTYLSPTPIANHQSSISNHQSPTPNHLRYPKAGQPNPEVEVCVYDIQTKAVRVMQLPEMDDAYIPRLRWSTSSSSSSLSLFLLRLNRDQNKMEVIECNPRSTISHVWYAESNKNGYVDYSLFDEWQWLSDGRVLVVSEQSGWRQAYLYSAQGQMIRRLTTDGVDITAVYGLAEKTQTLYYQQASTPGTRDLYAMNIRKNSVTRLSTEEGWNTMRLSADLTRAILGYESTTTPIRYTLMSVRAERLEHKQNLLDNTDILQRWQALALPEKEFFTFTTPRGDILHGWRLIPTTTTTTTTNFPVVMTQYSGPASQRVVCRWKRTWDYALAAMGYMVVCVDGRGTDARGRDWRNATYMNLGEKEAEDQIAAAEYVGTWENVDKERIAMVGWSYGGFQVLTTMSVPGHPFRAGIAIAPVTDWRLYDSAYTERYMRRPQVNESGYEQSCLLGKAHLLEGELLLVHGLADDNVHAQHTLLYSEALVAAGKQFEEQFYVDDNHQLRRRANYEHLHRRLLRFLKAHL